MSTRPEMTNLQAIPAAILVTYHADCGGKERFVVHQVAGAIGVESEV